MTYESQINFTLDTICPWTYIAKKRLGVALEQVRAENPPVDFKLHYHPFQLFHDAPEQGEDKYQWYKVNKYHNSEEQMRKYILVMSGLGLQNGIDFKFGGTIANTLNAHRVIQHYQEAKGPETADKIINSLYTRYFEQEQHPSSAETLLAATRDAGIPDSEAEPFVKDTSLGMQETKAMAVEQEQNNVQAVPHIVIEGKRRDFTLEGAKTVEEYVKTLKQVISESS